MGAFEFTWPHPAGEVLVTGTFDEWRGSIKLHKNEAGLFTVLVDLDDAERVYYKYIVDGYWTVNYDAKREHDSSGNENNVLYPEDLRTPTPSIKASAVSALPSQPITGYDSPPVPSPELDDVPGGFPETPAQEETEVLAISPLPTSIDSEPPVLPEVVTPDAEREEKGTSVLDVPEFTSIESNEPVGAAEVPEIVKESQEEAHVAPEASAVPEAVEAKKEVEQEVETVVPVAPTEPAGELPEPQQERETPVAEVLAAPVTTTKTVEPENQPPANVIRSVSPTMSPLTTPAAPTTHVYTCSVPGATFNSPHKAEPAPSTRSSSASSHESHNEKRELFKEKTPEKKKEKRRSVILGRILNLFK